MSTKAVLKAAYEWCHAESSRAARAVATHDYSAAIALAEKCLPRLHAAVTYQRRFRKGKRVFHSAVDVLLKYAPVLFAFRSLDATEKWYAAGSKAERAALPEIPRRLELARRTLATASRVWGLLSATPNAALSAGNISAQDATVITLWQSAGLVTSTGPADHREYSRTSDPRRSARGKCTACGRWHSAPLVQLLDPIPCPGCGGREPIVTGRSAEVRT